MPKSRRTIAALRPSHPSRTRRSSKMLPPASLDRRLACVVRNGRERRRRHRCRRAAGSAGISRQPCGPTLRGWRATTSTPAELNQGTWRRAWRRCRHNVAAEAARLKAAGPFFIVGLRPCRPSGKAALQLPTKPRRRHGPLCDAIARSCFGRSWEPGGRTMHGRPAHTFSPHLLL
jgi:hypothetical protein